MPNDGPRLLLIDGNNMAHRVFWANQKLAYKGRSTGLIFGFFKQLVSLHKKWPDHFRVISWDCEGGSARRMEESKRGVESGLVPEHYKQARHEKEKPPEIEDMYEQMDVLKEGLDLTRTLQVRMEDVESDDVLHTYAKWAEKWGGSSVVVSSDQDFYQLIGDGTVVYDAMKGEIWTRERFSMEFGFGPELWVDAGAIIGEVGPSKDNIFGVDGWGPKTTFKYVREFGGIAAIKAALTGREKLGKKEQTFIDSQDRLALAASLKRMDVVEGVPKPRVTRKIDQGRLDGFFLRFGFASLLKESWRLV
jgi:5'-3' exonuclease